MAFGVAPAATSEPMEGVVPAVGSGTSVSRASPASIGLRAAAAILAQRSMLACPSQRPGHCCEPGISGRDPKQPALQVPVAPSGHPGAGRLAGLPEAPAPPSPFSTPASPMSTEVLTGAPPTSPAPLREGVGLCLRRCPPERQAPSRPPEPRHAPRRDPRPSDGQRSRWGGVAPEAAIAGPSGARVLKDAIAYAASKGRDCRCLSRERRALVGQLPGRVPGGHCGGRRQRDSTHPYYSNYGKALDLVAPGGGEQLDPSGDRVGDGVLAQTLRGGPSKCGASRLRPPGPPKLTRGLERCGGGAVRSWWLWRTGKV